MYVLIRNKLDEVRKKVQALKDKYDRSLSSKEALQKESDDLEVYATCIYSIYIQVCFTYFYFNKWIPLHSFHDVLFLELNFFLNSWTFKIFCYINFIQSNLMSYSATRLCQKYQWCYINQACAVYILSYRIYKTEGNKYAYGETSLKWPKWSI